MASTTITTTTDLNSLLTDGSVPASVLEVLLEPYDLARAHLNQIAFFFASFSKGGVPGGDLLAVLENALTGYLQHLTTGYAVFVATGVRPRHWPGDLDPVASTSFFTMDSFFSAASEGKNDHQTEAQRLLSHSSPSADCLRELLIAYVRQLMIEDLRAQAARKRREAKMISKANRFMVRLHEMAIAQQFAIDDYVRRQTRRR
ncbi:hypothetical protein TYRP_016968 [Tyrophagus putrescentiae]|nr:hypothetical protein TYRP_016968 [Tyrophagus putrescentiae]